MKRIRIGLALWKGSAFEPKSWIRIRTETNADSQRWGWIYFSLLGELIE
jgi:hypothetical protein